MTLRRLYSPPGDVLCDVASPVFSPRGYAVTHDVGATVLTITSGALQPPTAIQDGTGQRHGSTRTPPSRLARRRSMRRGWLRICCRAILLAHSVFLFCRSENCRQSPPCQGTELSPRRGTTESLETLSTQLPNLLAEQELRKT